VTREDAVNHAEACANAAMTLCKAAGEEAVTADQQQALATVAQAYATAGAVFTAIAALREPTPKPHVPFELRPGSKP
jgi:hypothetical protein